MTSISRTGITDQVVEVLRGEIVAGDLRPGTSLREVALAERFDVARSTIREAIKVLVADGLATHELHRGAIVTEHTIADVDDLLRARAAVEAALGDTLERGKAVPEALDAAQEALERLRGHAEAGEWAAAASCDLEVHAALVAAVGSPRLSAFHRQLQNELRILVVRADTTQPEPQKVEVHSELVTLARAGDADGYRRAALSHVAGAAPSLRRLAV